MKKILSIIVALIMIFSLAACSGENSDNPNSTESGSEVVETPSSSNSNDETTSSNTEEPIVDEYNRYKKIADHNIYVNYKTGRRDEASLNSHLFYGSGEDIVMFVYGDSAYSGSLDGVFECLNDGKIPVNAIGLSDAKFKTSGNYPIVISESTKASVGSIESVKFSGSVTDANERVCYVYGYTFVLDETACMLVGFVFTEEQTTSEKDAVKSEIDKMMTTVRTEI